MRHAAFNHIIPRFGIMTIICITLFCYFSYHLVQGKRSYVRLIALENRIEQVRADYSRLNAKRSILEKRVRMLRSGSINRDLLAEQVRAKLGYRRKGERDLLLSELARDRNS